MRRFRRKYYDFFSTFYDRFVALHSSDREGTARKRLAEKTDVKAGERVLDICTGTGALLTPLEERTGEQGMVIGLDFSRGMLAAAGKKASPRHKIFLLQADAAALPFKEEVFDAVTCSHAFYELKGSDRRGCLSEVDRVLKRNRPFLVMEHQPPANPLAKVLYHIRILSMGLKEGRELVRNEKRLLKGRFPHVEEIRIPNGKSKIWLCRKAADSPQGTNAPLFSGVDSQGK